MKTLCILSLLGLVALMLVTGCQSSKPGSASHAALEIKGYPHDDIWTTTIIVFAEQGYELRTNSPTKLVFDRPATTGEKLKYGDWMNDGMVMQIKVRLQELEANTTLLRADAYAVQDPVNPVFRSERRIMSLSGKPYRLLLEEVLHRLEGSPPK
jgi:predicted component of type VI protein secretion system